MLKRSDFRRFSRASRQYRGAFLVIRVIKNSVARPRLGITVLKKFGKAHLRNRFKRQVREAFRASLSSLEISYDLDIKPRLGALHATSSEIQQEFTQLIRLIQF